MMDGPGRSQEEGLLHRNLESQVYWLAKNGVESAACLVSRNDRLIFPRPEVF